MAKNKQKVDEVDLAINQLGAVIKNSRKSQGLTQYTLGKMSGFGINFINQIESGKPTAHIGKVLKVLNVLGLQINLVHGSKIINTSELG